MPDTVLDAWLGDESNICLALKGMKLTDWK